MKYKKPFLVVLGLFSLLVFLHKLSSQMVEPLSPEEAEIRRRCVLGEGVRNFPFYVYQDGDSRQNHFFPTGQMGDLRSFQYNNYCKDNPYSGTSCIKISYEAKKKYTVQRWAGLYWQYPPNNWGNIPKAYDLSGVLRLTFWARGERGGEVINKFQVGGISGKYRDSGAISIGPVRLSKDWTQYTIDLSKMDSSIITTKEDRECWPFMEPLSRIVGGFCWATSLAANQDKEIVFYLDEIKFENE